jgi:KUP system potassium uptake protein
MSAGKNTRAALALAALGVVFGDIGTSPLYAFETAVSIAGADAALGVASLVLWTLFLVVAVKYVMLVMRADYNGSGGILALMALAFGARPSPKVDRGFLAVLMVFGAALLFGDGAITPAVSVLSAVEGLETVNAGWGRFALPLAVGILAVLFLSQGVGTKRLGGLFGPVMLVWFAVLAVLGVWQVVLEPGVLVAFSPLYAAGVLWNGGWGAWALVGAVVLAVTGAEALYADLGHFGRDPIVRAWKWVVFPSLVLNYLGQAALVRRMPEAAADSNLFFLLLPDPSLRAALVALATVATVIASQALISGVFSLASQAMDLGYLPRLYVRHTDVESRGQVFIPVVNAVLAFLCIMLVLGFRTGDALAGAYGIAVTGAMASTSVAFVYVMVARRGLAPWKGGLLLAGLLCLDLPLFGACLTKIADGGIVPLAIAGLVGTMLLVWRKGRDLVRQSLDLPAASLEKLEGVLTDGSTMRIPGAQVFVVRLLEPAYAAARIFEQRRRTHALPETVVVLLLDSSWAKPFAPADNIRVQKMRGGLSVVTADHGYMAEPDVPLTMRRAVEEGGLELDQGVCFYIIAQELLVTAPRKLMRRWERVLFGFLARNTLPGPDYLGIPGERLIVYNWMLRIGGAAPAKN